MVRIKHRYLLVNILDPEPPPKFQHSRNPSTAPYLLQFHRPTTDDLTPQLLARAIRDQILFMYGDYGSGITSTGLLVRYLSPATSTFILRCSRANYQVVWAALTFMTRLPVTGKSEKGQPCVMQVVRVSGTIRKAEEEVIRRAKAAILKARRESLDGSTSAIDAILGPAQGGGSSMQPGKDADMTIGIEDEDEDEDEDRQNSQGSDDDYEAGWQLGIWPKKDGVISTVRPYR
ncbi:MAG: hypothetical protein Q9201_001813 [Fulgogasparrea decipioides]